MANFVGKSRTNYFRVVNVAAFIAALAPYEIEVFENHDDGTIALFSDTEDGTWPQRLRFSEDKQAVVDAVNESLGDDEATREVDEAVAIHLRHAAAERGIELTDEDVTYMTRIVGDQDEDAVDIDLPQLVAPHLADGEVAVFKTVGGERRRYLAGYAIAITNAGEEVSVDINDIYALAKQKFGIEPTRAQL